MPVDEYINGEDDIPVCNDWEDCCCFLVTLMQNSDSSLPEDPSLQDFNHLINNLFEVHLSIHGINAILYSLN